MFLYFHLFVDTHSLWHAVLVLVETSQYSQSSSVMIE